MDEEPTPVWSAPALEETTKYHFAREFWRWMMATFESLQAQINDLVTGVSSVFGRTGAVVAENGDYNTSQIDGISTFMVGFLDDDDEETARETLGLDLVGIVVPTARTTAHTGWLLCYGQNVSRTTYAALFAAIGTTYGAGDGSTTFGIPDLRGRVVAGQDDMGGTSANRLTSPLNGDTLGAAGGAEGVTLTIAEMPSHDHDMNYDGSGGVGNANAFRQGDSYDGTIGGIFMQVKGGGGAHANVQPTIILNYMIFAGA